MDGNSAFNIDWNIRSAIQRLHKKYCTSPHMFLTEADVQCMLYSELLQGRSKKATVRVFDSKNKRLNDWNYQVVTIPLHAELPTLYRKSKEYVDLCIVDPNDFKFIIPKTKFSRFEGDFPFLQWEWGPEHSIGIEIKFNWWLRKLTKKNSYLTNSLAADLWKLRKYKRGWLIFVDQHSLIKNTAEWRKLIDRLIRKYNYGRTKRTLNAYYLCPKMRRALVYKPPRY